MKKIGLLSDTHSFLNDSIFKYFEKCDEIWHAGDVGDIKIIDNLKNFKPLKGVYGNIDSAEIRAEFPLHNRFMCENIDVWITHIGGYPNKYHPLIKQEIYANPPQLFICGHSHIVKAIFDKKINCLHLNPGAAGKYGWHKVSTIMRFEINSDKIEHLELIEMK